MTRFAQVRYRNLARQGFDLVAVATLLPAMGGLKAAVLRSPDLKIFPVATLLPAMVYSELKFMFLSFQVRMKGLEPSLLSELEPKSSASANFATSASVNHTSIVNLVWE